jgi:hypothetical protein
MWAPNITASATLVPGVLAAEGFDGRASASGKPRAWRARFALVKIAKRRIGGCQTVRARARSGRCFESPQSKRRQRSREPVVAPELRLVLTVGVTFHGGTLRTVGELDFMKPLFVGVFLFVSCDLALAQAVPLPRAKPQLSGAADPPLSQVLPVHDAHVWP